MHLRSLSLPPRLDLSKRAASLHWPLWLGVTVLALASTVDLIYHALPLGLELSLQPLLGEQAIRAHVAMFGGMLLTRQRVQNTFGTDICSIWQTPDSCLMD